MPSDHRLKPWVRCRSTRTTVAAALCSLACGLALAQTAPPSSDTLPDFAQLEAQGATIGEIRILNQEIFDLSDPSENNALFALANRLHIQTRASVIQRSLLLRRGERVSVRLIEESERLLRANRFLYDVRLQPVAYRDGVVDVEVQTRDTWSLDPGLSVGRSGGANTSNLTLRESNLLGTGMSLSYGRSNAAERSSNEFQLQYPRAFDGWTTLSYSVANTSDGRRQAGAVLRPFYALDARWAAGVSAGSDDRIDSVYAGSAVTAQYRHRQNQAEVFAGRSRGLVEGWAQRYSLGLQLQDDAYRSEGAGIGTGQLPRDRKIAAPFLRYEWVEDRFETLSQRDQIGRPEYFEMGRWALVQLGHAFTGLGSSQDLWLYSASLSQGFSPRAQQQVLASTSITGTLGGEQGPRYGVNAAARAYLPLAPGWLLYGAASADLKKGADAADQLTLGGDTGARGYPLRYQSGERRATLTLETRAYTDVYLWRLFRVGGAAFYDGGRAWGGANPNSLHSGWLNSVGCGVRIFNVRYAFGNVLHADVALPLNRDPSLKSVQFALRTKTSF